MAKRRKVSDFVQLNVRMKESLRRKIEKAADLNGTTMNAEVLTRLQRSFEPGIELRLGGDVSMEQLSRDLIKGLMASSGLEPGEKK